MIKLAPFGVNWGAAPVRHDQAIEPLHHAGTPFDLPDISICAT
jgi:hypothetical protein